MIPYLFHALLLTTSSIEKITLFALFFLSTILLIDAYVTGKKKIKRSKMLHDYLYLKNNRWNELLALLKHPKKLRQIDIQNALHIDISKFSGKYRHLLYFDLIRINTYQRVNPQNLKLFYRVLYNKI